MKVTKEQREKQNSDLNKKFIITLGIIALCFITFLFVWGLISMWGEGDPYFSFYEVPVNAIGNSTVIHLEDKDFMNMGLEVKQENGKISSVYFRPSGVHPLDFNYVYGSRAGDPSSRKYLEYKGVYYYGILAIP